jgi:hypothetical protein
VAPSLGVEVSPVNLHDASEIERAVTAFARGSNGGLIVTVSPLEVVHRNLIIIDAIDRDAHRSLARIWASGDAMRQMPVAELRGKDP